jgi:plastocyanin
MNRTRGFLLAGICALALGGIVWLTRATNHAQPHAGHDEAVAQAPATDRDLLPVPPERPIGSYGFSRYVYREVDGHIVPLLVEGPAGEQVRCQDEDLPCSHLELKELYESGAEIPERLEITRETLGQLVGQLDALAATLARYKSIHQACATGYDKIGSTQNPNMGIHMGRSKGDVGFDPATPSVLLFAKEGGERYTRDEIGECVGDRWTGDDDYQMVGAVFLSPPSDEHPEGFAGPFDNWHLHFNTCVGANHENHFSQQGSQVACEADGGTFNKEPPSWMIHAYAAPGFDNQSGVFSMWNPSIWPLSESDERPGLFAEARVSDGVYAPINNFDFGEISAHPGEKISFVNWDRVPHTVTAPSTGSPSPEFDSGALGTGEVFEISFPEPGRYPISCTLHPQMAGSIVVE